MDGLIIADGSGITKMNNWMLGCTIYGILIALVIINKVLEINKRKREFNGKKYKSRLKK